MTTVGVLVNDIADICKNLIPNEWRDSKNKKYKNPNKIKLKINKRDESILLDELRGS